MLAEHRLELDDEQRGEPVQLRLWSDGRSYAADAVVSGEVVALARTSHRALATEHVGGFLGVLLGIAAEAPAGSPAVVFSDVRYGRTAPEPAPGPAPELVGSA